MKSLIAHQLPKKTDRVVFCPLTELQRNAYETYLDSDIVEMVKMAHDYCECGAKTKAGLPKTRGTCCYATLPNSDTTWKALVFPIIITLQKLSNHLALLIPNAEDVPEKQQRDLETLQTMVPTHWQELYRNRDSFESIANPEFCGKVSSLVIFLKHPLNLVVVGIEKAVEILASEW